MPNQLDATGTTSFPASIDTLAKFLMMVDSPLAVSTLTSSIDDVVQTIPVADLGVFADGPSLVTIEGTEEIIWYTDKSAESGAGNLQNCKRNWGNNARRFAVADADIAGQWFEVLGNQVSLFLPTEKFTVYDSGANDGEYTVVSRSVVGPNTRILTVEAVTADGAGGTAILGALGTGQAAASGVRVWHLLSVEQLSILSDAMIATQTTVGHSTSTDPGSHEYRISQLEGFTLGNIFSLGLIGVDANAAVDDGEVVYWNGSGTEFDEADGSLGHIPLGTAEEVTNDYAITASDGTGEYFEIAGDHRAEFSAGVSFVVSGSAAGADDGSYVVISSALNGFDTRITVADVPTGTGDGTITVSAWKITVCGVAEGFSGLTPGTTYYLDPLTPGALTTTQNEWMIGVAYTATTMIVSIRHGETYPRILKNQPVDGTVVERNVVYYDTGTSTYKAADANGTYTHPPLGIAINVAAGYADIVLEGPVAGFSGLTPGIMYYLSAVAGGITSTQPLNDDYQGWIIGVAHSATVLRVQINRNPHAGHVPVDRSAWTLIGSIHTNDVQDTLTAIDTFLGSLTHAQVSSTDGTTDVTGAELEQLTDGTDCSALHTHDTSLAKRFLTFERMALGQGTDTLTVMMFRVPTGMVAEVKAYGAMNVLNRSGTVGWAAGDPTLITVTTGNTTGLEVGDLFYASASEEIPDGFIPNMVASIVDSTHFRVVHPMGGTLSGYYWWMANDNDDASNGLWWDAYRVTTGVRLAWVSAAQGNYETPTAWTASANEIIEIEVHSISGGAYDLWHAWVQVELT